jgi:septal ring factor EnvC (AmiA/AmiB activator)
MKKGLLDLVNAALALAGVAPVTMGADNTLTVTDENAEATVTALQGAASMQETVNNQTATIATLEEDVASVTAERDELTTKVETLTKQNTTMANKIARLEKSPADNGNPPAEKEEVVATSEDKKAKYLNNANNTRFNK